MGALVQVKQHRGPGSFLKMSRLARREAVAAYLFISPFLAGFLLFTLFPMVFSLFISLNEWDIARPPVWQGLANYAHMFEDKIFWTAVSNTAYYALLSVPLSLATGLGLALILNEKVKGTGIWRTIFYLPSLMPAVASMLLWIWIFNRDFGLLNAALAPFGVSKISWLGDPRFTKPSLILMGLWQTGSGTVIMLAALKGVPSELYDAAQIDGAGRWQRFLHITIPMISPVLFLQLIVGIIYGLQMFTQAFVLAARARNSPGGVRNSLMFYVLYLYLNAFRYWKMGYASALAWMLFLVILAITFVQFKTVGKLVYYEVGPEKQ